MRHAFLLQGIPPYPLSGWEERLLAIKARSVGPALRRNKTDEHRPGGNRHVFDRSGPTADIAKEAIEGCNAFFESQKVLAPENTRARSCSSQCLVGRKTPIFGRRLAEVGSALYRLNDLLVLCVHLGGCVIRPGVSGSRRNAEFSRMMRRSDFGRYLCMRYRVSG